MGDENSNSQGRTEDESAQLDCSEHGLIHADSGTEGSSPTPTSREVSMGDGPRSPEDSPSPRRLSSGETDDDGRIEECPRCAQLDCSEHGLIHADSGTEGSSPTPGGTHSTTPDSQGSSGENLATNPQENSEDRPPTSEAVIVVPESSSRGTSEGAPFELRALRRHEAERPAVPSRASVPPPEVDLGEIDRPLWGIFKRVLLVGSIAVLLLTAIGVFMGLTGMRPPHVSDGAAWTQFQRALGHDTADHQWNELERSR